MSDDDYMSEESYEFEFEDDDDIQASDDNNGDGNDATTGGKPDQFDEEEQLQNDYYQAKAFKDEDPVKSIEKLQLLAANITLKPETITWIYKCIKQTAKIHYSNHQFNNCLDALTRLKPLIPQMNDFNYLDESMNKTFNNYSNNKDNEFMLQLTQVMLELLEIIRTHRPNDNHNSSDRLWIKVNLNKFTILLNQRLFEQCSQVINGLNTKLETVSDVTKNSYSLEIIASEIELLSITGEFNINRLNDLYQHSLTIVSPVTHPRIIGIIKQCGGKLQFHYKNYQQSRSEFYESFKNFDESGSIDEKTQSFKYLILLCLITENEFNPFESQETQHYIHDKEFKPLILILENFNELDLHGFQAITKKLLEDQNMNEDPFLLDPIFKLSVEIISQLMVEKILLNIFKSFVTVSFSFIQDYLQISESELIAILMKLGTEGKLFCVKINFVDKVITSQDFQPLKLPMHLTGKQILDNLRQFNCSDILEVIRGQEEQGPEQEQEQEQEGDEARPLDQTLAPAPAPAPQSSLPPPLPANEGIMNIDDINQPPRHSSQSEPSRSNMKVLDKSHHKIDQLIKAQLSLIKVPTQNELTLLDNWYTLLQSSFPEQHQQELSTKDQIYSEQKLNKSSIVSTDINGISGNNNTYNISAGNMTLLESEPGDSSTNLQEKLRLMKLLSEQLLKVVGDP